METARRPAVTVLVDVYNQASFVARSIESALAQTMPEDDREIVVVDDGSTDDSFSVVSRYADRVRAIRKPNGGQASAFNAGLAAARGEIVAFLDGDDWWYPEKLEKTVAAFQVSPETDICYHYLDLVDAGGRKIGRRPGLHERVLFEERPLATFLRGEIPFFAPSSGISVRADFLRRIGPFPESLRTAADGYVIMLGPLYARRMALVREPLAAYRIHAANAWGGVSAGRISEAWVVREIASQETFGEMVRGHAARLGLDASGTLRALDRQKAYWTIFLHNLRGEPVAALRAALAFREFPAARRPLPYRAAKKFLLAVRAVVPYRLFSSVWERAGRSRAVTLVRRALARGAAARAG